MYKIKNIFNNLDDLDLKIMKIGLKVCFGILIFSIVLLSFYLVLIHTSFLYNLGITVFRLSIYLSVEVIICGIVADLIKKQINN
jgi:hypothetical protein